ncbi:transposase [Streptomyces sp. CS131]|uniref:transposase n=1 Tax=Streptomyces sp. CS131 TaxID=2162711 RepID=UPI0013A53E60|nr:transposase [Streptomyces sp. CS131]
MPPRDDVRTCAIGHPGSDGGALVVGETGFLQKGRASAGVQRQYTGTAGRIENSRAGVLPAYATDPGTGSDRPSALPSRAFPVL